MTYNLQHFCEYVIHVLFMEIVCTLLIAMKIDDLFPRIANIREQIVSWGIFKNKYVAFIILGQITFLLSRSVYINFYATYNKQY